jgi:glycosyltransferase involved in cell wall biosynthesis
MHITTYLQPERTYLPCTGVGKHINNILLNLANRQGFDVSLLVAQEYINSDRQLDCRTPLQNFELRTYPYKKLLAERLWKFLDLPKMDKFIGKTDCLYSPVAEYIPIDKNIPKIVTMHDMHTIEPDLPWSNSNSHKWQRLKTEIWISKAIDKTDCICTVSNYSKQRIVELLKVKPEKITIVGNGVDTAFFDIAKIDKKYLKAPIPEPYIIVIGGLRYKKGGYHVIEVAKELALRKSLLKILIVGSNESELVNIANTLDNIVLLGVIDDSQLPKFVRMASALLFLSLYEGFGIPMLEAMAVGTPAVVANKGAIPDVGGSAAIVVEPENAAAIADILINLDRDTQMHFQYEQLGRERANEFTWDRCVDRLVDAFHRYA